MEPVVFAVAKSVVLLAQRTSDPDELLDELLAAYPEADAATVRRACLYAVTDPTIQHDLVTKIYDVAIRLRSRVPSQAEVFATSY